MTDLSYIRTLEPVALSAMGVFLVILAFRLHRHEVMRLPAAISLGIAGFLAVAWKYPDLVFMPNELRLPFEVAEVQFFVALSICMTLFALDTFTGQARALARAEEVLRRQAAEIEKAAVMEQMAAIIESSDDAIVGQSTTGTITSWNSAATEIFGVPASNATGTQFIEVVDEAQRAEYLKLFERACRGDRVEGHETVCVRSDGSLFDATMTLAPIRDGAGNITGVSCIARDVTEIRRSEELRKLALTDELTGLNNRRGFLALAEHVAEVARNESEGFTILFMDLNGLKQVNDNLGHAEGDRLIQDAADVLRSTFRDRDVIARVGGDEFCVLLEGDQEPGADGPIGRLHAMLDIHNMQIQRPYKVAFSVGSATLDPKSPKSIEDLMQEADDNMYVQKQQATKARRRRLMVCDDDPSICALVEVLFSDDYDVFKALSGKQAVTIASVERPDLILLDLNLPDMSGTEVARQLRNETATRLIPIIMITGEGTGASEIESLRAGVDDYVEKPFEEDALRARMDNVLKRTLRR